MHISRTKDSAQVLPDARDIISRARTGKDFNGAYSSNGIIHHFYIRLADEWLTQLAPPSRPWRCVVLLPRSNVATFTGMRSSSWATHGCRVSFRAIRITAVAPTTSNLRRCPSPRLLMPPNRSLPPVPWDLCVSPSQAANWWPDQIVKDLARPQQWPTGTSSRARAELEKTPIRPSAALQVVRYPPASREGARCVPNESLAFRYAPAGADDHPSSRVQHPRHLRGNRGAA